MKRSLDASVLAFLLLSPKSVLARPRTSLGARDSTPTIKAASPFDHTWITNYGALGDSYAAGLGAGSALAASKNVILNTKKGCYQYSFGYPNLLNYNGMMGDNSDRVFHYLPCSGAKVPDVNGQIDLLATSDVITLSVGGNDIGFVDIINYCIFQWNTWEPIWTCQTELDRAKKNLDTLAKPLADLIGKVQGKLRDKNSRIYWTGYEHFWNADTKECDSVTWAFTRKTGLRQYLTRDHRKQMNDLVDTLNQKIEAACKTVDRCIFVNSNAQVDSIAGHFCEAGVDESYKWPGGGLSANRETTAFYEWGTTKDDDADTTDLYSQSVKPVIQIDNSTFEGNVAWLIREGLKDNTIDETIAKNALPSFTATGTNITTSANLPDYYAKIFHRTTYGNGIVAGNVLRAMEIEQGKIMKESASPTPVPLCAGSLTAANASTTAKPEPTPTSTGTPCQGNQIQGSCVQGHLPSTTPNSGPQPPVCNKVGTSNYVRISDVKAKAAVTTYCQNLISSKTVLDAQNTFPKPGTVTGAAEDGGQLSLSILFDVSVCPVGTSSAKQRVDFGSMSQSDCFTNLYTNLAQTCAQDKTWSGFNPSFPLEGGVYGYKCALWAISGLKT